MNVIHQQQTTKNSLASRLNPFKWMGNKNNNNNKTSGAQLQGNEMSVDDYDEQQNNNKNPAIDSNDIHLKEQYQQPLHLPRDPTHHRIMDNFYLMETLGKGMSGKVKKGKHCSSGEIVALKIIERANARKRILSQLHTEIMAMKSLQHPNILNLLHVSLNATYPRRCGETRQVMVIGLEMAKGGELFDFMMYTGSFSEILARTFFKQLLSALSICHSKNIYHRDIKPENLLLDDRFQLKVADFGLAAIRNDKEELLRTECGTRSYMAPEILAHKEYNGGKADVWSCAVVLFIMLAGNPPFTMAKKGDWWFNTLLDNNYAKFWKAHKKYAPHFPDAAQEFLSEVFIPNAAMRPNVDDLLSHPWVQGPVFSDEDLYHELLRRKTTVDQEKQVEKENAKREKEAKKNGKQFDPFAKDSVRTIGFEITEGDNDQGTMLKYDPSVLAPVFENEPVGFTNFYTAAPALAIVEELKVALNMLGGNIKMKDDFTMKVTVSKNGEICDMLINIYSVPTEKVQLVNISRKRGDPFVFNKLYKDILDKIPDLLVNSDENENKSNQNGSIVPEKDMLVTEVGMI